MRFASSAKQAAGAISRALYAGYCSATSAWQPHPDDTLFFHAPRGDKRSYVTNYSSVAFRKLSAISADRYAGAQQSSDQISFVTYSNYNQPTLLEGQLLNRNVIPHVVARDVRVWSWHAKIVPALDLLKSLPASDRHLTVLLDSNDVIPWGNLLELRDRFQHYSSSALFCGTPCDWPPCSEAKQFEKDAAEHEGMHHLSAGAYIGYTGYLIDCLEEIKSGIDRKSPWCHIHGRQFDDQLAWRQLHLRRSPDIKIDTLGLVFQRFDSRGWYHYQPMNGLREEVQHSLHSARRR